MAKKSLSDLKAELKGQPLSAAKPKRRHRKAPVTGRHGGLTTVQHFPRAGTLLRKTIYLRPDEWEALEAASTATGQPATRIVQQALRNELGLGDTD